VTDIEAVLTTSGSPRRSPAFTRTAPGVCGRAGLASLHSRSTAFLRSRCTYKAGRGRKQPATSLHPPAVGEPFDLIAGEEPWLGPPRQRQGTPAAGLREIRPSRTARVSMSARTRYTCLTVAGARPPADICATQAATSA
jgi:hypothetical protein